MEGNVSRGKWRETRREEGGGQDRGLKPGSQEISGFVTHSNHSVLYQRLLELKKRPAVSNRNQIKCNGEAQTVQISTDFSSNIPESLSQPLLPYKYDPNEKVFQENHCDNMVNRELN